MVNETMAYMFKLKGDNLSDMDIWNYAQPYYGKKMAFAFGDLYYWEVLYKRLPEMSTELRQLS
jgi:hypothetical protein